MGIGTGAVVLAGCGNESRSMFAFLRNDSDFYLQHAFYTLKRLVEEQLGVRFQLRSGCSAYGQRLLDGGNKIEDVSVAMGHASTKTTEGYYTRTREDQAMSRIMANDRSRTMM